MNENCQKEYKSFKKAFGKQANISELAELCVAFANASGGIVVIGVEDKASQPPEGQKFDCNEINKLIHRLRSLTSGVIINEASVITASNGSEYLTFEVPASINIIATTSSGKVFIRLSDNTCPVSGEALMHLAAERNIFHWEITENKTAPFSSVSTRDITHFVYNIRNSKRVGTFIKQKTDEEILEHYKLISNGYLTNLGILWLGNSTQRNHSTYSITVQYIVYDALDNKIHKEDWHGQTLDPMQLLLDIEEKAIELKYFFEIPHGLFRKQIPHYDKRIIRELLINAFAHRSYTLSGDIFIKVYPDRLEITNPGSLPLGITKDNILHKTSRRNPGLIQIFHDFDLMEGEGSGYDLIYEIASRDAKEFPLIETCFDSTTIIQKSRIVDEDTLALIDYTTCHFDLKPREVIALGIIAREKKILTTRLVLELQLKEDERMRFYITGLIENGIILARGIKKGTHFLINPKLIADSRLNIRSTLKTIEPHRLKALIIEDLKMHPLSTVREIQERISDVPMDEIRRLAYNMVKAEILCHTGGTNDRRYTLI